SVPFTSDGLSARISLKSAPSSMTRLVTRTIVCSVTASTEPNCLVIHSFISGGATRRPTLVETAKIRVAAARASTGSESSRSSRSVIVARVSIFRRRASPSMRPRTSRDTASPMRSTSGPRASLAREAPTTAPRRRERRVESEGEREPSLRAGGELAPLCLVRRIAAAKHDQLCPLLEQPRSHRRQQVDALLLHEASDHAEDRRRRVDDKARFFLEDRF